MTEAEFNLKKAELTAEDGLTFVRQCKAECQQIYQRGLARIEMVKQEEETNYTLAKERLARAELMYQSNMAEVQFRKAEVERGFSK